MEIHAAVLELRASVCFLCIDISARDRRVLVHTHVCDVDVGGHS